MTAPGPSTPAPTEKQRLPRLSALWRPIEGFRLAYLPLGTVFFAYGALGLIDVSRDLWIKEKLSLSPAELAGIGVWLNLPWIIKMVFGELVDSVPILGSQRKSYILIGAGLTACGLLTLAGTAAGAMTFAPAERLYVLAAMLMVIGTVLQNVVAEAMSTEVVSRRDGAGNPLPDEEVKAELGLVQVIGRLALSAGILAVAGLSGLLASLLDRPTVFLLALLVPVVSVGGILLVPCETRERRPLDWRILGGGLAFGAATLVLALGSVPFGQELAFVLSLAVICTMLFFVTREFGAQTRRAILFTSIVIFVFRATPMVGDGYFWWTLDVLKFDAEFYGVLRETGAVLSIVAMWLLSRQLTEYAVTKVLFWIVIASTLLSLPGIGLFYGLHHWTQATFGFGPRTIVLVDTATASPLDQLSMIPLLTLIAYYAPAGHRATWFALMASLMNTALVAGQLQSKYLNGIFVIERGHYDALGPLLITVTAIALVVPLIAIALFGRRI